MDAYDELWEDREAVTEDLRRRLAGLKKKLAGHEATLAKWPDAIGMANVVEWCKLEVQGCERSLESAKNGMLPPMVVSGNADHFRAVANGEAVAMLGPSFEYSEANGAFDRATTRSPIECSYGKSNLAKAEEIIEALSGEGVDEAALRRLADFMYSAGRYRERVALAPFESDVRARKSNQQVRSKNGANTAVLKTEEDWYLFRLELGKYGRQWTKLADAMTRHGRSMSAKTASRYAKELAQEDSASDVPK